jgi:hypothetical protein
MRLAGSVDAAGAGNGAICETTGCAQAWLAASISSIAVRRGPMVVPSRAARNLFRGQSTMEVFRCQIGKSLDERYSGPMQQIC